jgi:hypothetical protein
MVETHRFFLSRAVYRILALAYSVIGQRIKLLRVELHGLGLRLARPAATAEGGIPLAEEMKSVVKFYNFQPG